MNAKQMGWTAGARVYVVHDRDRRYHKEFGATVIKVGREWVTFQPDNTTGEWAQDRFHCETMHLHAGNFSSAGRVYQSQDDYLETQVKYKEWRELVSRLPHHPPKHLTLEDVRAIAAMITPTRAEAGAGEGGAE